MTIYHVFKNIRMSEFFLFEYLILWNLRKAPDHANNQMVKMQEVGDGMHYVVVVSSFGGLHSKLKYSVGKSWNALYSQSRYYIPSH